MNAADEHRASAIAALADLVQQVKVSGHSQPWRVCVRYGDGAASAAFHVDSYEHVLLFERHLQDLGFEMLVLDEHFRCCDFVSTAASAPAGAKELHAS